MSTKNLMDFFVKMPTKQEGGFPMEIWPKIRYLIVCQKFIIKLTEICKKFNGNLSDLSEFTKDGKLPYRIKITKDMFFSYI